MSAMQSAAAAMAAVAQELQAGREETICALEQDALELALALAEKVVAGAIDAQPKRVLDVLRGALRHIADRRSITILVDPADMEIVSAAIGELRATVGGIEQCDVQADRRIGPGGALVRTVEGEVDMCVDVQLQQARELLASELGARPSRSASRR